MTVDAVGGVWTYALELGEALALHGVDVVVAAMGPRPSRAQRRELSQAPFAGYHERGYSLEWMDKGRADNARARDWVSSLCDSEAGDILHVNGYALAALPVGIPIVVAAHSCLLSWSEAVRRQPAGIDLLWYARAVEEGLNASSAIVAPTAAMLADIERLYRPRSDRLVIPNGRSSDRLRPGKKEPFVLGAGRVWDEAKNLGALERVAAELEWPVLIAGAGGGLGHVSGPDLADLLGRASIFAAPACYEPFGLAALEAGLSGCALVVGDIPSQREVWGTAAAFVDPFDDEALAATLRKLISDPQRRAQLGAAARRRALEYTPERTAGEYLKLYTRLLQAPETVEWPVQAMR
jgi:glycosyltransferase involved in cell wall biosynthesis